MSLLLLDLWYVPDKELSIFYNRYPGNDQTCHRICQCWKNKKEVSRNKTNREKFFVAKVSHTLRSSRWIRKTPSPPTVQNERLQ